MKGKHHAHRLLLLSIFLLALALPVWTAVRLAG
jgi:hypothetical protein